MTTEVVAVTASGAFVVNGPEDGLAQMQAEVVRWCLQVAGGRACGPLGGAAPAAVFDAVDREALAPLPRTPFVLVRWSTAVVGPDIHVKVGKGAAGGLNSVPWRFIGQRLDARATATSVQIFARGNGGGELIANITRTHHLRNYMSAGPRNYVSVHTFHELAG